MTKSKRDRKVSRRKAEKIGRPSQSDSIFKNRKLLIPILIILGITFLAFLPTLSNEFVNWDDDVNLLENENVRGLDAYHLKQIFTSDVIGNYNPLPILTFAIEYSLVEYKPFLYHFNNLLLHLLVVFLAYRLGLKLGLNVTAAALLALLFGIHPMRVESVAWVTERKDVLFSVFYLAALIQYIKYLDEGKKSKTLIWIYLFFILSLFSKIQAVALPLSMLAIDYWRGRNLALKLVWEKIPYFALSLLFGLLGVYMLSENESLDQTKTNFSFVQRLFIGAYSYCTYWYKLLIPYPMSPLYPYPKVLPSYIYISMAPALGIVGLIIYGFKKNWKAWVFGSVFFTFNIVFLLQILGAGQGFLADRFTYMAYFGLFFSIAYYADRYLFSVPAKKTIGMASVGVVMLAYFVVTYNQNKIWENGATLWTHVLKYHSNVDTPFRNRGNYYRDNGIYDKAMQDYFALVKIDSTNGQVYNSIGKAYFEQQNFPEAMKYYIKATQFAPEKGEFWVNLAATRASLGDMQGALQDVTKGIETDPTHGNAYQTRFLVLQYLNRYEESIRDIDKLIEMRPREIALYYEKGRAYLIIGQTEEGIKHLSYAISKNPNEGIYYNERGKGYLMLGNKSAAASDFANAQKLGIQVPQELINQAR